MDGTRVVYPRPDESAEELERRSWTKRDAAMAGRVLAAPDAVGGRLVVAGNVHTKLKPLPVGVPMGAHLARQRPGLRSIDFVCGPDRFYNLGPQLPQLPPARTARGRAPTNPATGRPSVAGAVASRGDCSSSRATGLRRR